MTTKNQPPTPDMIRTAFADGNVVVNNLAAALHLCLPADEVATISVTVTATTISWRDVTVTRSGDPVVDAYNVVCAGRRDSDQFLDLTDSPATWVKTVRSGAGNIVAGVDVLFGGPTVTADVTVDSATIVAAVDALRAGTLDVPGVFVFEGRTLIVDTNLGGAHFIDADVSGVRKLVGNRAGVPGTQREMVDALSGMFNTMFNVETTAGYGNGIFGFDVYGVYQGQWELVIPVISGAGDVPTVIGVPVDEIVDGTDDVVVPDGFEVCGTSLYGDCYTVAAHRKTGVRVLLRPVS